jgi:diacylglycerol kinase family enzyme
MTSALVKAVRARTGHDPVVADGSVEDARIAFADAAARRPSLVVVAGGDGTVRQAAAALGGTGIPLAIVPCGTGNVLASGLRLGGPAAMARALPTAVERVVDLGQVTWGADPGSLLGVETFVVACGMGLDARIMDGTEPHLKRRFSFAAYMASAAREILRPRPSRFLVDVDGDVTELTGLAVLVANAGELIPGLLGPRQAIDPCDGRLEVLVLGGRNAFGAARAGLELLLRTDGPHGGVALRRSGRTIRVRAEPAQPIQIDGDVHGRGWLDARIEPGALTLLVPPGA